MTDQPPRKRRSPHDHELIEQKEATLTEMAQALNTDQRDYAVEFVQREGDDYLSRYPGWYLIWYWSDAVEEAASTYPKDEAREMLHRSEWYMKGSYLGRSYKDALAALKKEIEDTQAKGSA